MSNLEKRVHNTELVLYYITNQAREHLPPKQCEELDTVMASFHVSRQSLGGAPLVENETYLQHGGSGQKNSAASNAFNIAILGGIFFGVYAACNALFGG